MHESNLSTFIVNNMWITHSLNLKKFEQLLNTQKNSTYTLYHIYEILWYVENALDKCNTYSNEEDFIEEHEKEFHTNLSCIPTW